MTGSRRPIPPTPPTTRPTTTASRPAWTTSTRASGRRSPTVPEANRKLLTYHDSWAYWAREYGFKVIGAVQASDFSDPSPRDVAGLIDQIRAAARAGRLRLGGLPQPRARADRARDRRHVRGPAARRRAAGCAGCSRAHLHGHARASDMQVMMDALGGQGTAIFADYPVDATPGSRDDARLAIRPASSGVTQPRSSGSRASAPATAARPCSRTSTSSCPAVASSASWAQSGAGKTTLLRAMVGQVPKLRGRVLVDGRDVAAGQPANIGWVPQLETVDWDFPATVREVVLMGRWARAPLARLDDRDGPRGGGRGAGAAGHRRPGPAARSGSCPAASSSGSSWPARSSRTRCCCCSMSPPAASTSRPATRCCTCWRTSTPQGITIVLTTHELNSVAAHLPWVVCVNRRIIAQGDPDEVFTAPILNATYCGGPAQSSARTASSSSRTPRRIDCAMRCATATTATSTPTTSTTGPCPTQHPRRASLSWSC